jgi:hypothetical protein
MAYFSCFADPAQANYQVFGPALAPRRDKCA